MRITRVVLAPLSGSYFYEDIRRLHDTPMPVSERYRAGVRVPGEALGVGLVLDDGRVAWGDCVGVSYAGTAGRDPCFLVERGEREVASLSLVGALPPFRAFCRELRDDSLHTATRYGVSQALLVAHAFAAGATPTEIVCRDWDLPLPASPVGILAQSANLKDPADRMMARRVASLPHGLVDDPPAQVGESGEKLVEYARWLSRRLTELGDPDYRPVIHLDVHGALAGFPIDLLLALEQAAAPYALRLESVFVLPDRAAQIAALVALKKKLHDRGSRLELVSDELANTREDILAFAAASAGHMVQVKMPDLGGIDESVDTVLGCREHGMRTLLGGSCNETDLSARISAQVALAVRPDLVLGKPGMGVDEGIALVQNEMARTLAELGVRRGRLVGE